MIHQPLKYVPVRLPGGSRSLRVVLLFALIPVVSPGSFLPFAEGQTTSPESAQQKEAQKENRYRPSGGPIVPGLRHTSPETAGELLLGQLQCTACHDVSEQAEDRLMPRKAPSLKQIGARVTPAYIRSFLKQPHKTKPGTPMPDLLHDLPEEKQKAYVNELTSFLVSRGGPVQREKQDVDVGDVRRGKHLYHKTGCVVCHQPFSPPHQFRSGNMSGSRSVSKDPTASIPLPDLPEKTTLDRLTTFLNNPLNTHPSGRMPIMKLNTKEARQVASYLYTKDRLSAEDREPRTGLRYTYYHGKWEKLPDFTSLSPVKKGFTDSIRIDMNKRSTNFAIHFSGSMNVSESGPHTFFINSDDGTILWIDGRRIVDNDGIHASKEKSGTIKLSPGPHRIRLGYFQRSGGTALEVDWKGPSTDGDKQPLSNAPLRAFEVVSLPPPDNSDKPSTLKSSLIRKGKKRFTSLGCAECHQSQNTGRAQRNTPDLASLDPSGAGCLNEEVPEQLPDYHLTDNQRRLLRDTLRAYEGKPLSPNEEVHRTLATFNCYACHERNNRGGPEPARQSYFTTTEHGDFGSEARFPPHLNRAGAKLSDEGLRRILIDGEGVRPYMSTHMPRFGKQNVGHLLEAFPEADRGSFQPVDVNPSAELIKAGRKLVGNNGLGCITCHRWQGYPSTGMSALDIGTVTKRLRPEWFFAYLKDPQALRPGTRMPGFWTGSRNPAPDVLNGNTRRQMAAIWSFLSQGDDVGLPAGIQRSETEKYKLVPAQKPIVYRSFLKGVGVDAITVGFPEQTHVAFDALGVRLARAWQGEFLSVKADWHARGGKSFNKIPGRNVISFPPAPAFAMLEEPDAPWPEYNPKGKQKPEHFEFDGYRLTSDRTPIFQYRFRSLDISEKPEARVALDRANLHRSLDITSPEPVNQVWFRVFVAPEIEQMSEHTFRTGSDVEISIKSNSSITPKIRDAGETAELLVPVKLQKTDSNTFSLTLDIGMRW